MIKIKGKEIAVVVIGGASRGGSGWGITPSGKVIKIEDNNPIEVISELAPVAERVSDSGLRAQVEGVLEKAVAKLNGK
jgi:hypothetical protein